MSEFTDALDRLATKYNGNGYDPSTNPGGLDNGGHTANFVPALRDVSTVGMDTSINSVMAQIAADTATTKASEASTSAGLAATAKTAAEAARDDIKSTALYLLGECRLDYTSATALTLSRYNGYRLVINNVTCVIPTTGVTLANSGVANTTYYIYAYWTGVNIALEYSTTGHSFDARNGVAVKNGDVTRSLVGMARTNASGQWVDSDAQRFVSSWFNRIPKITSSPAADFSTASTSIVIVALTSAEFLSWGEVSIVHFNGMVNNLTSNTYNNIYIRTNIVEIFGYSALIQSGGTVKDIVRQGKVTVGIGYNALNLYAQTSAGTSIWSGTRYYITLQG